MNAEMNNEATIAPADTGLHADSLPDLLTIDEVAAFLRVSKATVYGWRKEDKAPPAVKIGKHLRFPKVSLLSWVATVTA